MATPNEDTIIESLVRRESYLARFASYLINKHIGKSINDFAKQLPSLLGEFGEYSELNKADRNKIDAIIRQAINEDMAIGFYLVTQDMIEMMPLDSEHVSDIYDDFLGQPFKIPDEKILASYANAATMVLTSGSSARSGVWSQFVKNNIDSSSKAIIGQIDAGYGANLTNAEIERNIRGTYNRKTKMYQGGILQGKVKNQAASLVRTGVSHYSNSARDRTYAANKDIIETRIFYAVMDNRTSKTCMTWNLQEWPIEDKNYPRIPQHINCRSAYIVRLKGIDPLEGTKPAVQGTTNDVDYSTQRRGNKDERYGVQKVPSDMDSDTFLRLQPRKYVESSLGVTGARLFLDGKLPISKFTDLTGRPLSIKELKESGVADKAFRLAGID